MSCALSTFGSARIAPATDFKTRLSVCRTGRQTYRPCRLGYIFLIVERNN